MAADISTLEKWYLDSCKRHGVSPIKSVSSSLFKAKVKKARHEVTSIVVCLDDLKDDDFYPLLDLLCRVDISEIDAVDVIQKSSCLLSGEYVLLLLRAVNEKLRVVDLQDILLGKDLLLDLAQHGLACQVLQLKSSHFRKLNLVGRFMQLHTLNLDFSASLTSFREDCFCWMPNLNFLSLCETRISNLWTTSATLVKLPCLTELRFQNCLCWDESGGCCIPSCGPENDSVAPNEQGIKLLAEAASSNDDEMSYQISNAEELDMNDSDVNFDRREQEYSSDNSEVDFSTHHQNFSSADFLLDASAGWDDFFNLQNQDSIGTSENHDEVRVPSSSTSWHMLRKCSSCHSSPICYEHYYREYMIASLPKLKRLDNLPIEKIERERANIVFLEHFEYLPYKRMKKESVVSILCKREIRAHHRKVGTPTPVATPYKSRITPSYYSRSLSAAKMGSSAWPAVHPLSSLGNASSNGRSFRPRQFEYHPSDSSLMVFGTLDGEVVVVNHESDNVVSYIPSLGLMNSVLGLCWLRKHPSKLIAGSDNGSLRLYDVHRVSLQNHRNHFEAGSVIFDDFDQLTSVHVNSTDELFLASGYSNHVALYDIGSGRRLQFLTDMHREHINVVKFSNHSPSIFATSSFDQDVKMWDLRQKPSQPCYTTTSSRGNVMVCFSPDDKYLLVSAVDNEVKQLLAADGRLHLDFGIPSTGSSQNYTRSYYMNGRDYVISGSCDEHVVRICCAQTGRRLRDVSLEGKGSGASMFVQSLRGDPFRDFNMSVLAAYVRPSSNSEIVKVNLLACNDSDKVHSCSRFSHPSHGSGG
ncbi:OLC1v1002970C2 [Oldenlandia corymbosa var. corymbosa]|uniref:OLC1v1002970C2 n=1 Tax=Oldenlandia corymbosa var. corymbosa TaxID=529605 RepID=A0AAV1DCD1_OLDCO|nr:OLC1v1002970C2 [Oldenlandia corymbosa var. corymbosa]